MAREFTDYLKTQGIIDADQVQQIRSLLSRVREPIGSIAFSYGLLTVDDVDLILAEQRREHRQFGEIAAGLGILTTSQVQALVHIQETREAAQTAEALVLSGIAPHDKIMPALGRYLQERHAEGNVKRAAA